MSSMGSGVGGDLGTPQTPSQTQWEATAWTQVTKQALGITSDILELPAAKMNYTNVWKYRSSENQPSLSHPLENARVAGGNPALADNSWQALYGDLVQQLSDEPPGEGVKSQFVAQMAMPYEERSGPFIALDNLLTAAAKLLTLLNNTTQPIDPSSLIAAAIAGRAENTSHMLNAIANSGPFFMSQLQQQLAEIGPNFPQFDQLLALQQQFGQAFEGFNQLAVLFNENAGSPLTQESALNFAGQMQQMNQFVQGTNTEPALGFLKPAFQSLTYVAEALAIGNTSIPGVYLSLLIGLSPAKPGGEGLPGSALSSLINGLFTGVSDARLFEISDPHMNLLRLLTLGGMGFFTGIAPLLVDPGYGLYPQHDPAYLEDAKEFALDIALHMMIGMGVVEGYLAAAYDAAGVPEEAAQKAIPIYASATYALMLLSGAQDLPEASLLHLIESHEATLISGLQAVLQLFGTENPIESVEGQNALIAAQQGLTTLQNGDYESFLEVLLSFAGITNQTSDKVTRDMTDAAQLGEQLINASKTPQNDTRVITVV